MKNLPKILKTFILFVSMALFMAILQSCMIAIGGNNPENSPSSQRGPTPYAPVFELDAITNGSTEFIYWRLSRFFAVSQMFNFQLKNGWTNVYLSDRAVIIYDGLSKPKYYEFRVCRNGEEIGIIAANAQKIDGDPVQFILDYSKDYGDIYSKGVNLKVLAEQYPSSVFYGNISFPGNIPSYVLDPATGQQTNIRRNISILDLLTNSDNQTLSNLGFTNNAINNAIIQEQKTNISLRLGFWAQIYSNLDKIIAISDSEISNACVINKASWLDEYVLTKYWSKTAWYNPQGWCGPNCLEFISVASGYYPDVIESNPGDNNQSAIQSIYDYYEGLTGTGAVLPSKLNEALMAVTPLALTMLPSHSLDNVKQAIQSTGFPVVSLRSSAIVHGNIDWGFHYRVICGVKREFNDWGFSIFGIWIGGVNRSDWFLMHDNGHDGGSFWEAANFTEIAAYPVVRYKADPPPLPVVNPWPVLNSPLEPNNRFTGLQTITLNWQPAKDAISYRCIINIPDGTSITNIGTNISYSFMTTKTGRYRWYVYSIDSTNGIHYNNSFFDFYIIPLAPSLLTPTNNTIFTTSQTNVCFNWTSEINTKNYILNMDGVCYSVNTNSITLSVPIGDHVWYVTSISHDGLVYSVPSQSNRFVLKKSWQEVGVRGFSSSSIMNPSIAINSIGSPYIVFSDVHSKVYVMLFTNNNWENLGNYSFAIGSASKIKMVIDKSDNVYLLYDDNICCYIKRYDGAGWHTIDIISNALNDVRDSLVIDESNTLYVLCKNSISNSYMIMRYKDNLREQIGYFRNSDYYMVNPSITLDKYNNPYVIYSDYTLAANRGASVLKYNGSIWQYVGIPGFSNYGLITTLCNEASLVFIGNNVPFSVFTDGYQRNSLTSSVYNGSMWIWGSAPFQYNSSNAIFAFSPGLVFDLTLRKNVSNNTYIAFNNNDSTNKTQVMKYDNTNWSVMEYIRYSSLNSIDLAIDDHDTPYLIISDSSNINGTVGRATVINFR